MYDGGFRVEPTEDTPRLDEGKGEDANEGHEDNERAPPDDRPYDCPESIERSVADLRVNEETAEGPGERAQECNQIEAIR